MTYFVAILKVASQLRYNDCQPFDCSGFLDMLCLSAYENMSEGGKKFWTSVKEVVGDVRLEIQNNFQEKYERFANKYDKNERFWVSLEDEYMHTFEGMMTEALKSIHMSESGYTLQILWVFND